MQTHVNFLVCQRQRQESKHCMKKMKNFQQILKSVFIFSLLLLSLSMTISMAQEVEDERKFNYIQGSKTGPENWGGIKTEWATCKTGKIQSPINLVPQTTEIILGEDIVTFYQPDHAVLKNRGHDVMIKWNGQSNKVWIKGTHYILVQCHWHSPSEHAINHKRYALELHLVHQSPNKDITVITHFYDLGEPNPFLLKLEEKLKLISNSSYETNIGAIDPAEISVGGNQYYKYVGSLTTPPCTEGVIWIISKHIGTVSEEQVEMLRNIVDDHAKENARPLQR